MESPTHFTGFKHFTTLKQEKIVIFSDITTIIYEFISERQAEKNIVTFNSTVVSVSPFNCNSRHKSSVLCHHHKICYICYSPNVYRQQTSWTKWTCKTHTWNMHHIPHKYKQRHSGYIKNLFFHTFMQSCIWIFKKT